MRGDFGIRCGDPESDALKARGLRVSASPGNTNAALVIIGGNTELAGSELTGGRVGIELTGRDPTNRASNVFLRSVRIAALPWHRTALPLPTAETIRLRVGKPIRLHRVIVRHPPSGDKP